jgi:sporulation protein YlmC with PRC-barrel domain
MVPQIVAEAGAGENRLDRPFDAYLHLLDRQVVDVDGRMVCKVDDLEVTEHPDRTLEVTGFLSGPAALWPRLGARDGAAMRRRWLELGLQAGGRERPGWIDTAQMVRLTSEVQVGVPRDGLVRMQPLPRQGQSQHTFNQLLHMDVVDSAGHGLGHLVDVGIRVEHAPQRRLLLANLVFGSGRPGSRLGYDRGRSQGPAVLRTLVRAMHRHTASVPVDQVDIDWAARRVTSHGKARPVDVR